MQAIKKINLSLITVCINSKLNYITQLHDSYQIPQPYRVAISFAIPCGQSAWLLIIFAWLYFRNLWLFQPGIPQIENINKVYYNIIMRI